MVNIDNRGTVEPRSNHSLYFIVGALVVAVLLGWLFFAGGADVDSGVNVTSGQPAAAPAGGTDVTILPSAPAPAGDTNVTLEAPAAAAPAGDTNVTLEAPAADATGGGTTGGATTTPQ